MNFSRSALIRPLLTGWRVLIFLLVVACASQVEAQPPEKQQALKFWHEKTADGYRFFVSSQDAIPRSIQVSFPSLRNLVSSKNLPLHTVVAEKVDALLLLDLKTIRANKGSRFKVKYDWVIGDYRAVHHNDSTVYLLPFEHGTKHAVGQGYHGKFSHFEPDKAYAIDFTMPEGTPVMAARDGIVIKVKEDSTRGGASKSYQKDGNKIVILHQDGSYAEYVHLQKNGAEVSLGDRVKAGDRIGLSGNTGRTTGPHLHFNVAQATSSGVVKYLPTQFYNHLGERVTVQEGMSYYSFHPGNPSFETIFGADITHLDYEGHRQAVPETRTITKRIEKIDGTELIFFRNGYPTPMRVEVSLPSLENLSPSQTMPVTMVIEPQTERFAFFLRETVATEPNSYKIKWSYRGVQ